MSVRILSPRIAARRTASVVVYDQLTKRARPLKRLRAPRVERAGRGAWGRITVRHRGGGQKRFLRLVDWGEERENIPGVVETVEYDPNRSAFLARVLYRTGERRYVLAWHGAASGQKILASVTAEPSPGNRLPLTRIPVGSPVFNVELKPRQGGRMIRSAGSSAVLQDIAGESAQLRLASGEIRFVPAAAWATIGQASNPDHRTERIGWAGRKRRMGWRPSVRGKAMNAVDHPHGQGGGGGHTSIGLKYPKTPWGKHALGVKTRRKRKYSDRLIVQRREKT